jgi:hypothetical protein
MLNSTLIARLPLWLRQAGVLVLILICGVMNRAEAETIAFHIVKLTKTRPMMLPKSVVVENATRQVESVCACKNFIDPRITRLIVSDWNCGRFARAEFAIRENCDGTLTQNHNILSLGYELFHSALFIAIRIVQPSWEFAERSRRIPRYHQTCDVHIHPRRMACVRYAQFCEHRVIVSQGPCYSGIRRWSYPRTFRQFQPILAIPIGLSTETGLPNSYYGEQEGPSDGPRCNGAVCTLASIFLVLIAPVFVKYGLRNIYDGPCDWRGVTSLWVGFVPFAAGFLNFVFYVFPA